MAIGGAAAFIGAFISTVVQGFSSGAPDNIGEWAIPAATSAAAGAVGGLAAGPAMGAAAGTTTGATGSAIGAVGASAADLGAMGFGGAVSSVGSSTGASLLNAAENPFLSSLPTAADSSYMGLSNAAVAGGTDSFWSANAGQLLNSGVKLAGSIAPMFASQPEIQPVNAVAPPLLPPVREQTRDAEKSPEKLAEADYRRKTNDRAYAQQKQADELANIETMLNYQRALEKTGKGKLLTPTTASQRFSGTPPSQGGYI